MIEKLNEREDVQVPRSAIPTSPASYAWVHYPCPATRSWRTRTKQTTNSRRILTFSLDFSMVSPIFSNQSPAFKAESS